MSEPITTPTKLLTTISSVLIDIFKPRTLDENVLKIIEQSKNYNLNCCFIISLFIATILFSIPSIIFFSIGLNLLIKHSIEERLLEYFVVCLCLVILVYLIITFISEIIIINTNSYKVIYWLIFSKIAFNFTTILGLSIFETVLLILFEETRTTYFIIVYIWLCLSQFIYIIDIVHEIYGPCTQNKYYSSLQNNESNV